MNFTRLLSLAALGLLVPVTLAAQSAGKAPPVGTLPYEGKDTVTSTLARTDLSLILRTWRVKGVLACSHGLDGIRVCLWVENAYPSGILEVLRQPYKSQLAEMQALVQALQPVKLAPFDSSSHSPVSADGTTNQFAETRVATFVPDVGLSNSDIPIAIPSFMRFQPNYVSEMDSLGWRSTMIDTATCPEMQLARLKSCGKAPDPVTCAGTWGSYYPRIGFINHPSAALAAAMQALRAGRAASRPLGRLVLSPYDFEPRTGHWLQMVEPLPKLATSIGSPFPELLDAGGGSTFGNYLFVHFGVFEYCAGCLPCRLVEERPPQ